MSRGPQGGWLPLAVGGRHLGSPAPVSGAVRGAGERLLNRDLSWLAFNERVLSEAANPDVPPVERLRFATIVSSNLDEFFMVRVADVARRARTAPHNRYPDGLTAAQVLALIREEVLRQKSRQAVVLEDVLGALAENGILIARHFDADRSLDRELQKSLPSVDYILRKMSDPLPPLPSERLHVFVRFPGEYAILSIPEREARLVKLATVGRESRYALLERWLAARAGDFFPRRPVVEALPFKIIREADLRYRPDDEDTLEAQIVSAVRRRPVAKVVRLEVDAPAYSEGALFLANALRLDSAGLYRFDLPLDLRTLALVCAAHTPSKLSYAPVKPVVPEGLTARAPVFETIAGGDLLLHHPYDAFDAVVNFLHQAAVDPAVTRIYHTMYRTTADSPIMAALAEAVRRGKDVTAYVEIKARFDELNNVRWANELRKAGVRVVAPFGGLKVHSKMTQVIRMEKGVEVSYLHLGTGNYHPRTATQYTDLSLLTRDQDLGREIAACFTFLARGEEPPPFSHLLVAPRDMHRAMLRLVREERQHQLAGRRGHIIGKMNALVDPDLINALYEAAAAGVKVELWVRGICCLRPGFQGLSDRIRVVSVIDRFLEHSRIYYFRAGGERKLYLSSADWMPRNFYSRFEIAFPIRNAGLVKSIREVILANGLADNVKAWNLQPDGSYERVARAADAKPVRSQDFFQSLASAEAGAR